MFLTLWKKESIPLQLVRYSLGKEQFFKLLSHFKNDNFYSFQVRFLFSITDCTTGYCKSDPLQRTRGYKRFASGSYSEIDVQVDTYVFQLEREYQNML